MSEGRDTEKEFSSQGTAFESESKNLRKHEKEKKIEDATLEKRPPKPHLATVDPHPRSRIDTSACTASHQTETREIMSASLNEAAMAGSVEEVTMRLNLGEDVNQKLFPRSVPIVLHLYNVHSRLHAYPSVNSGERKDR